MKTELSLSGTWRLTGRDETGKPIDIPVQVPGHVHPALEAAGALPPVFWRDNAKRCQWPEKVEWTFSHTFEVPADAEFSRAELCFGGIDTYADIFLNGKHLGSSRNMFVPLRAKATDALRSGANEVRVVIHPYAQMIQGKRMDCPAAFTSDRVHVRRVQCTFWWDWVERFVSPGIWKETKVVFWEEANIEDLFVYTQAIAPTSASLAIRLQTAGARNGCRFAVAIMSPDGHEVWRTAGRVFSDVIRLQADLPQPRLWWPNGYGDQPRYQVTATLFSNEGTPLDERAVATGIRTVRLECLRDQPGSPEEARTAQMRGRRKEQDNPYPGESCILLVNGVRIFCKGGNWVPPSPFPGNLSASHYENLVRLASEAGFTMLRVWGGGEYEPDVFYSCCDQYGILLFHDFMLACGDYPEDDPEFVENFREEVRANVLALRNHCCIAIWSGNNENCDGFDWDDAKMTDRALLDEVYYPVLEEVDPSRPFRPGSPWGGLKNADATIGDCHDSWWWRGAEKISPEYFSVVPRFSSECPIGGYPLPTVLRRFLAEEDLAHPDNADGALEYHIKNNHYFTDMGWPTVHGRLIRNTRVILGEGETPGQKLFHRAYLQYEWARMVIEGMRRGKWYSAATLFWMFNDCWPALGYALVDYCGRPKAGWYACRRVFAPVAAAIAPREDKLVFTILNDRLRAHEITARILEADTSTGQVKTRPEIAVSLPPGQNLDLLELPLPPTDHHTIFFLELAENGRRIDRARWCAGWLADLAMAPARLSYERRGDTLTVRCHGGIALGVAFDGAFVPEDNYFDLLPGEERALRLRPPFGSAETGREVIPYAYSGTFA
ncbi:MAG: hypothetical protein IKS83_03070 [Victivallales bacterium]|nr:hypothetical protein [Victivallales bacterium]